MPSPGSSGSAPAPAAPTSPSSSSTRPARSRPASGTTSSCSTSASARATPCACSGAWSASATVSSSRCARSSRRKPTPPSSFPSRARDVEELDGFFEFLAAEIAHPRLRGLVARFVGDDDFRARLRILPATQDGPPLLARRPARAHGRRRLALPRGSPAPSSACVPTSCSLRRSSTTPGARGSSTAGPLFLPTAEGRAPRPRPPRPSADRGARRRPGDRTSLAEVLHAVSAHHDARAARTAEATVLYHANQLDAAAAMRPVTTEG